MNTDMKKEQQGKGEALAHFIKYNNAVPIILGLLFFSTSATFAAVPAVRDSVYSSATEVRSVDNSFLLSADLDDYDFSMRVTAVSEDAEWFYIDYELDTVDIADAAWQAVTYDKTLRISKALLRGGDLRAYAESELAQVRDQERQLLTEAKEREKKNGLSQKVVATVYKGLVGKLIAPDEETAPYYQPSPEEQAKNDPLRVKNPKPLITWDENAKVIVPKPPMPPSTPQDPTPEEGSGTPEEGPETPGDEPPATTTPPTETPPEEPPAEEEPPIEEPSPEPEPQPEPEPEAEAPTP
jgi:hypothetical protein